MKHENDQLINLLNNVPKVTLADLGLEFRPSFRINEKVELMVFISKNLSRIGTGFTKGTVFTLTESDKLKDTFSLLCISGDNGTGNCVIFIDMTIFNMEQRYYKANPKHIDLLRCLKFGEHMSGFLRGRIGEVCSRYKKLVNEVIQDRYYSELEEISLLDLIHELILTGNIPNPLKAYSKE